MLTSLTHLCDLAHWIASAKQAVLETSPGAHKVAFAHAALIPLADHAAYTRFLQPYVARCVQLGKVPLKSADKTRFYRLCRQLVEQKKSAMQLQSMQRNGGILPPPLPPTNGSKRVKVPAAASSHTIEPSDALQYQYSQLSQQRRVSQWTPQQEQQPLDLHHFINIAMSQPASAAYNAHNAQLPASHGAAAHAAAAAAAAAAESMQQQHIITSSFAAIQAKMHEQIMQQNALDQARALALHMSGGATTSHLAVAATVVAAAAALPTAAAAAGGLPPLQPVAWLRNVAGLLNTWQVPPFFQVRDCMP